MRNYVIINGVNSTTIQGLAINILPPITKPMMRTQIEEIDGRDGDLVTELGYSAYDKTMEIGLWGTYDIDAIIKYFTGDGTIVFSTEPDKYYYFKILNQIDYEKLLKFKKATVTFHCQPYKYTTSETPLEEAYEYVEATGTDITLNNTEETIFNKFDLIGNIYQETTNGNQLVDINAFNDAHTTHTFQNDILTITASGGNYNSVGQSILDLVKNNPGKTIKFGYESIDISGYTSTNNVICQISITNNGTNSWNTIAQKSGSSVILSGWTIPNDTSGITTARLGIYVNNANVDDNTSQIKITKPLLYFNNNDTYEPYTGGIPAPNPDFPEDIHVVSGDNEIEIYGKNLINVVEVNKGVNSSGVISGNDTYYLGIGEYVPCKPNTTYTITFEHDISTLTMYIGYKDQNGNFINRVARTSRTFTTPNNAYSMFVYVYKDDRFDSAGGYVQLEYGNTATPFEEYQSQTYPINLPVENLFDKDNGLHYTTNASGTTTTSIYYNSTDYLSCNVGDSFTISGIPTTNTDFNFKVVFFDENKNFISRTVASYGTLNVFSSETTTAPANAKYVMAQYQATTNNCQLEKGTKANSYSPFGTTSIEMCSIPNTDYKDTFVHEDNKWYKRETIRKVILDGTENWGFRTDWQLPTASVFRNAGYVAGTFMNETNGYSNYFQVVKTVPSVIPNRYIRVTNTNGYGTQIFIENDFLGIESTDAAAQRTEKLKTWLAANNTSFYGVSPNPDLKEITDETLKAQLDDLWENATSYKGQTNITQTNNDLPFIMDVSALELGSDHLIINNTGTAYSKPTIDIEGTGIVDIYLNDEQIFEIDMTNENEIIIDTEKMEAYTPDNLLANRLVTGDYSNFKLAPGENDLRFSGDLTKATVTRYIRWI